LQEYQFITETFFGEGFISSSKKFLDFCKRELGKRETKNLAEHLRKLKRFMHEQQRSVR
jgi:hypothetical protein